MKKSVKMTALVLAAMLVLAGCGKTETVESVSTETSVEASVETSTEVSTEASVETSTETSVEASVETSTETSTEASTEVVAEEGMTLEEYVAAHPEEVADFDTEEEGLSFEIKGNTAYFSYNVPVTVDDSTKALYKESLDQAMAPTDGVSTMAEAVKELEEGCGIEGILFVMSYVDEAGTVIATYTFNNEGLVEE